MSKVSPVTLHTRYSENTCPDGAVKKLSSKLNFKNLIIGKIFKLSLEKAENCLRQVKNSNIEVADSLVLVEREYVKNLLNREKSHKRGDSGEIQRTPERKISKNPSRKKSLIKATKHVRRASSIRRYDFNCNSPLTDKHILSYV